jgi:hypothetical protein
MTHELLDIASNHADDKEVVAAALNAPQGKWNQVVDHGEGTFSRFKEKKKKNDKCRRDDNFITVVERKMLCPKGNLTKPTPSKDHFERLLDTLCPHHEIPDKNLLRDCRLEQLRQWHHQAKSSGPAKEGRVVPRQRQRHKGCITRGRQRGAHDLQGISSKTLEAAREAHPTRSLQHRCREAVLPKVVGGSYNL